MFTSLKEGSVIVTEQSLIIVGGQILPESFAGLAPEVP